MLNDWCPRAASSMPHTSRPMSSCLGQRARRAGAAPTVSGVPFREHRRAPAAPRPVNSMSPRRVALCELSLRTASALARTGRPAGFSMAPLAASLKRTASSASYSDSHVLLPPSRSASFTFPSPASVTLGSFARSASACSLPLEIFSGHHHRRKATRIYRPSGTNPHVGASSRLLLPWASASPPLL